MISYIQHKMLRTKFDTYQNALEQLWESNGRYGVVYPEDRPYLPPAPTNEEISAIEVYEFVNDPPEKYLAYVNEKTMEMTTWTGEKLGRVGWGRTWKSNFGDVRVSIDVDGINDARYHGTFFKSAGDYCIIRAYKAQPRCHECGKLSVFRTEDPYAAEMSGEADLPELDWCWPCLKNQEDEI
jgi:hypothetical protein